MAVKAKENKKTIPRPPVIVIMGHIDHGKSTLLDYIRKTNVVETETGGITQHLSAYEAVHTDEKGAPRTITFLDTPGHEAFGKMRLRGAEISDIAILIVSAEEGVKPQTLEAHASIKEAGLPYIVAINKIDRPSANVERTKQSLLENEIYLEGLGGDVPWVPISAKEGTGVIDLLNMALLVADLEELTGEPDRAAEGVVIEVNRDPRKGISATLIIRNGTLKSGEFVVSGSAVSPVRIFENFLGESIKEARFSSPVQVVGWDDLPEVGAPFTSFENKKEAEAARVVPEREKPVELSSEEENGQVVLPIIIKADVAGSLDAVLHEIEKIKHEKVAIKIVQKGVGAISENDVKTAGGASNTLVIGFNTDVDRAATDLAERTGITVNTFDIIYQLSEWLEKIVAEQAPRETSAQVTGRAKILKNFSRTKNKQVLGGRVEAGMLKVKSSIRIIRQETEIGHGTITNLQQQKAAAREAAEGSEFGAQIDSAIEIAPGDYIESYTTRR
jgi:translation initiation factor IF-2